MTIPDDVRSAAMAAVTKFCGDHSPPDLSDQVQVESSLRGDAITLVERRAPWTRNAGLEWTASEIAQLRYDEKSGVWSLRWRDSNERWHSYERVRPSRDVGRLLAEIDADPTGIFWG